MFVEIQKNLKNNTWDWNKRFWLFVLFPVVGFSVLAMGLWLHWSIALLVFPWAVIVQIQSNRGKESQAEAHPTSDEKAPNSSE
ncbi:MAG: hypothetical protein R3F07_14675 [Opitutaceae bacterium]